MATVGDFLAAKVKNMRAWLVDSGISIPEDAWVPKMFLVQMASELLMHEDVVRARDFERLKQIDGLPEQLKSFLDQLEPREDLHDKFWRYLALFADTVNFQTEV